MARARRSMARNGATADAHDAGAWACHWGRSPIVTIPGGGSATGGGGQSAQQAAALDEVDQLLRAKDFEMKKI